MAPGRTRDDRERSIMEMVVTDMGNAARLALRGRLDTSGVVLLVRKSSNRMAYERTAALNRTTVTIPGGTR
jgi:23S rRNA-/tRNA-specific pseudouridylate synthase